MKTDNLIQNIVAFAILVTLFLIGFTWIIFDFSKSPTSLKDSLTIVSTLFGGVATLTAAYIASKLFNDWTEQEEYYQKKECINKVIEISETFNKIINSMKLPCALFASKRMSKPEFTNILLKVYSEVNDEKSNLLNNINHLSLIKNKNFSSESLFTETKLECNKLIDKIHDTLLNINKLEQDSKEFEELKAIMEDLKKYLNSKLIKILKTDLRHQ
ncbi:hypothetical protein [Acinetobacter bereziniae]|uniref:hypothetical protein n=1 Tax=Acinetobacter bereziniae TaxID=106648 RepID=UPI0011177220|nr:hypothetical protein [Acinetobacter bereziniae]TNL58431.1 hypothetical protein EYY58_11505 [Acinetobacter bereziniae]